MKDFQVLKADWEIVMSPLEPKFQQNIAVIWMLDSQIMVMS